jgi:hypothetical protein
MTENRYKRAEIRERNKIIMDNEARKAGYKSWNIYMSVANKLNQKLGVSPNDDEFDINIVPVRPALPLLALN